MLCDEVDGMFHAGSIAGRFKIAMATIAIGIGDIEQTAMHPQVLLMASAATLRLKDFGLCSAAKVIGHFVAGTIASAIIQLDVFFFRSPERVEPDRLKGDVAFIASRIVQVEMSLGKVAGADLLFTRKGEQPCRVSNT